jgi:hypothetical protein
MMFASSFLYIRTLRKIRASDSDVRHKTMVQIGIKPKKSEPAAADVGNPPGYGSRKPLHQ